MFHRRARVRITGVRHRLATKAAVNVKRLGNKVSCYLVSG